MHPNGDLVIDFHNPVSIYDRHTDMYRYLAWTTDFCIIYFVLFNQISYDVVVASYALSEIPKASLRKMAVQSLWGKTSDFLVSNFCLKISYVT